MQRKIHQINVFLLFAEEDESYKDTLEEHLSLLSQQGKIAIWHKGKIGLGRNVDEAIKSKIKESELLLLLISANFLSPEVYGKYAAEIRAAYQRQQEGRGQVIPVILRPCLWQLDVLSHLEPLPKGGHPVRSRHWDSKDLAFQNIAMGILNIADQLQNRSKPAVPPPLPGRSPKQANDKDQIAAQLINGIFELMLQQPPEAGARNVLHFIHPCLVVRGQLEERFYKYNFLKAYERLTYYRVPVQIKSKKPSGRTCIGVLMDKQEGEEWIYTLHQVKDLGGLGGKIRIFFPKDGSEAKISAISI